MQSVRLQSTRGSCLLQVIAPTVNAYLYTWAGYRTAEGEFLPVRVEAIELGSIAGMLLLPTVVEHTIDERSPLYGHTHDSLVVSRASWQEAAQPCSLHAAAALCSGGQRGQGQPQGRFASSSGSACCLAMGCAQLAAAAWQRAWICAILQSLHMGVTWCMLMLQALQAEIVVTFEGTAESGAMFMSRRSYLPTEIHWGYVFAPVVKRAPPGQPRHIVDLWRWVPLQHCSCPLRICSSGETGAIQAGLGIIGYLWRWMPLQHCPCQLSYAQWYNNCRLASQRQFCNLWTMTVTHSSVGSSADQVLPGPPHHLVDLGGRKLLQMVPLPGRVCIQATDCVLAAGFTILSPRQTWPCYHPAPAQ